MKKRRYTNSCAFSNRRLAIVQAQAAVRQAEALEKLAACVGGGGLYVYPKDKAD